MVEQLENRLVPAATITTLGGGSLQFLAPFSLAVDSHGNVWELLNTGSLDGGSSSSYVEVTPAGVVTTYPVTLPAPYSSTELIPTGGPPVVTAGSKFEQTGVGPFVHNNPKDRPPEIFGATVTLHFDAQRPPFLLLPVIPQR